MTETPKCPYCGAETRLNENNEGIYWYECRECHATGPTEDTREEALSAALHRAEPENHPMTREEVESHCEDGIAATPLWVEFKNVPDVSRWMCAKVPNHVFSIETINIFMRACGEKYGKTCRCWPRKPTPEQMAAAKWEEEQP